MSDLSVVNIYAPLLFSACQLITIVPGVLFVALVRILQQKSQTWKTCREKVARKHLHCARKPRTLRLLPVPVSPAPPVQSSLEMPPLREKARKHCSAKALASAGTIVCALVWVKRGSRS